MAVAIAVNGAEPKIQGAPIRLAGLVKDFGSVRAVNGVSIDVKAGEFLALLGPSGSGKTTILMTIAGFEQPTGGEVFIGDRAVTHVPAYKRNLGMVFQKYALFPHMTVAENIAFPLKMRRAPMLERAARVERALELVRLSGYGARKPSQLSGGQQQRVALARAIVYWPPVLLMDEPLGALDKKLRERMQLEIKHLQRTLGATVVYVTHDQEEALTMADRIAVLNEGRLEQIGPPEELYERPANSFVADFLGETNFLDGVLGTRAGDACTVALGGELMVQGAWAGGEAWREPDQLVRVAIRPERVALGRPRPASGDGHAGTVIETVYAGNSVACVVRLRSGVDVMARVPSGSGRSRWQVNDAVEVTWRPEDARVYPAGKR